MVQKLFFSSKYRFLQITGVLVITLILWVVFYMFDSKVFNIYLSLASLFITTIIIWAGSKNISEYFINRYVIFKEPLKLLSLMTSSLVLFSSSISIGEMFFLQKKFHLAIEKASFVSSVTITVLITLFITTVHASYYFFTQWKENRLRADELEKATLEARFETLRSQLNPHFLFNSLNTLLTMVDNNPKATQYVESLSDFLRYVLQTREKEAVLLRDELAIARQYVFIQQNRFGDKLQVNFDVPESYYHYAIPPLSLQMLLENALKHNVVSKEHNLRIDISVTPDKFLVVENKIQPKIDVESSTGIGLSNIDSRYRILSGRKIVVSTENTTFRVMLPLLEISL